jgi:hypothetical protein
MKEELLFRSGKKVNLTTVNKEWLAKVEQFKNDATYDNNEKCYYIFKKDISKIRGFNGGFTSDMGKYPSCKTLLIESKKIDPRTSRLSSILNLYDDDFEKGRSFYRKHHEVDIMSFLTGISVDDYADRIGFDGLDRICFISFSEHLRCNFDLIENNLNTAYFQSLLNLINIISKNIDVELNNLNCHKRKMKFEESILSELDYIVVKKIELAENDKKIDKLFKRFKTLRDLFMHHDDYQKNANGTSYILIRNIFIRNKVYLILLKKDNIENCYIYEYDIKDLFEKIRAALKK